MLQTHPWTMGNALEDVVILEGGDNAIHGGIAEEDQKKNARQQEQQQRVISFHSRLPPTRSGRQCTSWALSQLFHGFDFPS